MNNGIIPQLQEEIATLKAALNASNAALAEAKSTVRKQQEAMESAIDSLEPYLNANSPYTPAVLEAASYLSHALEDSAAVAATTQDESE